MKKVIISEEEIPVQIDADTTILRKQIVVVETEEGRVSGEFCPPRTIVMELSEDGISGKIYPPGDCE